MPGDLTNPAFMFPFHYDPKYEPGTNTFDSRPLNIREVIQSIARKIKGKPLSKREFEKVQDQLDIKHLLHRNPGDSEINQVVEDFIKHKMARKVVAKWLT